MAEPLCPRASAEVKRGGAFFKIRNHAVYGVRSRRTRLLEDQLGRADAGSWQIADRYYMAS